MDALELLFLNVLWDFSSLDTQRPSAAAIDSLVNKQTFLFDTLELRLESDDDAIKEKVCIITC